MKVFAYAIVACLTGCMSSEDDLPIQPAGGGTTNIGGGGATAGGGVGGGSGSGSNSITGRACVLLDPRDLGGCASSGAGGLQVALGTSTATTAPDGTFSMQAPQGTGLSFQVSGPGVVPTSQPFAANNSIPVLTEDMFNQVLGANGIVLTPGSGSILASVVDRGGIPVAGATAMSTPSPAFGPFFDGTTPSAWTLNGTGERGVVLFPGVTAGPAALTFANGTGGESTVDGVQVIDGGVTIVDAVLP